MVDPLRRRATLLDWYDASARDLPWRHSRDPYAVLVSELMLQQTQVARVAEAFPGFLDRYPTITDLADAQVGDVLVAWRGLGYNRRAVALHRAAVAVRDLHGGTVPDDLAALLALPGVGPYTARAVLAFAFGQPVGPLDVNVARVLSRAFAGAPLSRVRAQRRADAEVAVPGPARDRPGDWSQALMDLGRTHCRARGPVCTGCPIAGDCAWHTSEVVRDPAASTAVRSRPQSRFAGSDRQYRGRLLDALRSEPVAVGDLADRMGLVQDQARAERLARALEVEGLARRNGHVYQLP